MVKVIIQTEDKTIVKEGDFFFGSVAIDETDGYQVNDFMYGEVNTFKIAQIMTGTIVNMVKKVSGPDMINQICALFELSDRINKEVDNELTNNKEQVLSDICKAIDGLGR